MNINNNNILTYNGEIYNHLEIRKKIKEEFGANFSGNSDTETLYHALQNYSIHKVLNMISGMFGFCYYDSLKNDIYIARDRAGKTYLSLFRRKYIRHILILLHLKKLILITYN